MAFCIETDCTNQNTKWKNDQVAVMCMTVHDCARMCMAVRIIPWQ
jgi:hypothetical protein